MVLLIFYWKVSLLNFLKVETYLRRYICQVVKNNSKGLCKHSLIILDSLRENFLGSIVKKGRNDVKNRLFS